MDREKLSKTLKTLSECLISLRECEEFYQDRNQAKRVFLSDVCRLADTKMFEPGSRQEKVNLISLTMQHLRHIWGLSEKWEEGAKEVWEILKIMEYPRKSETAINDFKEYARENERI